MLTAALVLRGRGHHRVAPLDRRPGASLAAYAAVAGARHGGRSPWVVAVEAAWFIVPITLAGICCLVAAEELLDAPGSLRWGGCVPPDWRPSGLVMGFGTLTYDVYPGVPAPLGHTILGHPAAAAAFGVGTVVWMLSATIAPALVFRAAATPTGLRRGRLTIAAIAATTPLLTLATCVLLWAGFAAGLLDDRFATTVLTVAFFLPPALVAAGRGGRLRARDDGVTGSIGRAARWVLRGSVDHGHRPAGGSARRPAGGRHRYAQRARGQHGRGGALRGLRGGVRAGRHPNRTVHDRRARGRVAEQQPRRSSHR